MLLIHVMSYPLLDFVFPWSPFFFLSHFHIFHAHLAPHGSTRSISGVGSSLRSLRGSAVSHATSIRGAARGEDRGRGLGLQ